mmetsp:Transcript_11344/g.22918  ORF Transcript_11344/g.22918 Transcript_11344/m.22918 type:complete len:99 (+) Transcript_11344:100-396(+)
MSISKDVSQHPLGNVHKLKTGASTSHTIPRTCTHDACRIVILLSMHTLHIIKRVSSGAQHPHLSLSISFSLCLSSLSRLSGRLHARSVLCACVPRASA